MAGEKPSTYGLCYGLVDDYLRQRYDEAQQSGRPGRLFHAREIASDTGIPLRTVENCLDAVFNHVLDSFGAAGYRLAQGVTLEDFDNPPQDPGSREGIPNPGEWLPSGRQQKRENGHRSPEDPTEYDPDNLWYNR